MLFAGNQVKVNMPAGPSGCPTGGALTAKDRTLDTGKAEELRFNFPNHFAAGQYRITVEFVGRVCSVTAALVRIRATASG